MSVGDGGGRRRHADQRTFMAPVERSDRHRVADLHCRVTCFAARLRQIGRQPLSPGFLDPTPARPRDESRSGPRLGPPKVGTPPWDPTAEPPFDHLLVQIAHQHRKPTRCCVAHAFVSVRSLVCHLDDDSQQQADAAMHGARYRSGERRCHLALMGVGHGINDPRRRLPKGNRLP